MYLRSLDGIQTIVMMPVFWVYFIKLIAIGLKLLLALDQNQNLANTNLFKRSNFTNTYKLSLESLEWSKTNLQINEF